MGASRAALLRGAAGAVATYFALSAVHVFADRAILDRAHPTPGSWVLAKVVLPVLITLGAFAVARAAGLDRRALGLVRVPPRYWSVAVLAGAASVLVVAWHGATQGFAPLIGAPAARLALRVAIDQAWLEELLARGVLLAMLLARGTAPRRAAWLDAGAFGAMHMLQFLWPPVTAAGLENGAVLLAITVPMGYALAVLTLAARSVLPAMTLHFLIDLTILPQTLLHANIAAILAANVVAVVIVIAAPVTRRALHVVPARS